MPYVIKKWSDLPDANTTDDIELVGLQDADNYKVPTAALLAYLARQKVIPNPMTAVGDIIIGGASGLPTRLAAGTNTYVLTLAAGVPTWAAPVFAYDDSNSIDFSGAGTSASHFTGDVKISANAWNAIGINVDGLYAQTPNFTPKSIIFAGSTRALAEDNTNFVWDYTNLFVGIGTNAPAVQIHAKAAQSFMRLETTSSASNITGAVPGAYAQFFNTTGQMGIIGCHTSGYSNPGTVFLANQTTLEVYGAGGLFVGSWAASAPIVFGTANGGTMAERLRIDPTTGYIGINGVTSPTDAMHLSSTVAGNRYIIKIENLSTATGNTLCGFQGWTSAGQCFVLSALGTAYNNIPYYTASSTVLSAVLGNLYAISTPANSKFVIATDSGTPTSANERMAVSNAGATFSNMNNVTLSYTAINSFTRFVCDAANNTTAFAKYALRIAGTEVGYLSATGSLWTAAGVFKPSQANIGSTQSGGLNVVAEGGPIYLVSGGTALANIVITIDPAVSSGTTPFILQRTNAGALKSIFSNLSNANNAYASISVSNDAASFAGIVGLLKTSTTFTTSGLILASQALIQNITGPMLVYNSTANDIVLAVGGSATGNEGFRLDSNLNVSIHNAALATNATNGFLYITTMPGIPSGTATAKTGRGPLTIDSLNGDFYFNNGAWRRPATVNASVSEFLLATTAQTTVATFTPASQRNYVVFIYYRVITGSTNVTLTVTWTDSAGAQTSTPVNVVATAVGSYILAPIYINSTSAAITVKATASVANQLYVSSSIQTV